MAEDQVICYYGFQHLPDDLLLKIFSNLPVADLARASYTCQRWFQVSLDDLLWKGLFYHHWHIAPSVPMAPGKHSWRQEFKRLYYYTPVLESENIGKHKDQVLHVSFSHNGQLFATCSKDGTVKVWTSSYPATLKFEHDMKEFTWKYTQFSNFNESDTLLLVSGVHFGNMSTSGEIAVFSLTQNFELQCRVINKPYDVFGTWYDDTHLLSGNLHWTRQLNSCSALWLNKASQSIESERESVVMRLFRFLNTNASSIRTIMISKNLTDSKLDMAVNAEKPAQEPVWGKADMNGESQACVKVMENSVHSVTSQTGSRQDIGNQINGRIIYRPEYWEAEEVMNHSMECSLRQVEIEAALPCACCDSDDDMSPQPNNQFYGFPDNCRLPTNNTSEKHNTIKQKVSEQCDKLLIFTMGSLTYTPHQIGIKRIDSLKGDSTVGQSHCGDGGVRFLLPDVDENNHGVDRPYDSVDEIFDMDGHIIGMSLSPDHRYLYVNSRPWPPGYEICNPLQPPPIAQEIDVHVIDLCKMKEVGTMLRSHKAFTPNDECFFIFLDVCEEYVASGAEDKHGYIWDRHYGICLHRFPHSDVVNCVAFNPVDSEVLITVSDDNTIKIWRSKNQEKQIKSSKS
ncbi:F-box/WD repeat-containing protein 5-like [Haliotis cracherodii]|uniref:F-box/WD repeat-containing protein 5-like n=1 Tax=Haliotis cracherodii TaxID=6455 RepID=UPI0039E9AB7D